jgi:hypothetical protein
MINFSEPVPAISTVDASPIVKVQSTSKTIASVEKEPVSIDPKNELLTEEELAINAAVANRKRRRPSDEQPIATSYNPRVVKAPSPMSASSPIASIDKLDCNIEKKKRGTTFLKVEHMAPDAQKKMQSITEEPQQSADKEATEDFVRIRKESVAPKVDNNVPKIDLDDDQMDYADLLASGEDDDVDVDGDIHVERLMPVYIDVGSPVVHGEETESEPKRAMPRLSKTNSRLKATRYIAPENDSDDNNEGDEDNEQRKSKPTSKKRKAKLLKGKDKALVKKKLTSGKSSKKGGATAISIGIGVPTASSSTSIVPTETAQISEEEEEFSDKDSDGNRIIRIRKKRNRGPRKQHKYAYRLVQNMRTLDDIANDPSPADNLEKPMSDFTKDIDGIVSKAFKEMEGLRSEAKKKDEERSKLTAEELDALKKKEAEEERIEKEKKDAAKARDEERRRKELDGQVLAESSNALQVRLVNGEIVLDADSLVVERTEGDVNYGDDPMEVVEENSMTKKVNSSTYGKRKQSSRWDELETALFYDCLSQFGTDFEMIANMMPGRTRNQVRTKFNREEKVCPEKVTEYMISKRKLMGKS